MKRQGNRSEGDGFKETAIGRIPVEWHKITLGELVTFQRGYDFKNPQQLDFDHNKYEEALRGAEALGLDFRCVVDKLHLLKLTDDFSSVIRGEEFTL